MKILYTKAFRRDFQRLPTDIQRRTEEKLSLLLTDPRHPSLQTRKLRSDPTGRIWYGRITRDYRFTFQIEEDTYVLLSIGPHNRIERRGL